MRAPFALLLAGLMAAACTPEAPGGGEAVPPADAPPPSAQAPGEPQPTRAIDPAAPFRQDFVLLGTEPFWRLDVKGTALVLKRPEEPDLTAINTGLAAGSGKAIWTAQSGPATVIASLIAGKCSDGMSGRTYPYVAEVKVGDLLFRGCGMTAEAFAVQPPA